MSIVFIDSLIDACHSVGVSAVKLYKKISKSNFFGILNFVYFHIIVNKKKNKSFGFAHLCIYLPVVNRTSPKSEWSNKNTVSHSDCLWSSGGQVASA